LAIREERSKPISYTLQAFSLLTKTSLVEPTNNANGFTGFPESWNSLDQPYLMLIPEDIDPRDILEHSSAADGLRLIFATGDKQSRGLFRPSPIAPMLEVALVQKWLCWCKDHHDSSCMPSSNMVVNFRVIDCEIKRVVPAPPHCSYVCLSYAWPYQPPSRRDASFKLPSPLPNIFSDAMSLTISLGMRYLWIDRFCIDQLDIEEKQRQIEKMDTVYSGAQLTIIAAGGRNQDPGLPGVHRTPRDPCPSIKIGDIHVMISPPFPHWTINSSHWDTRGWTYQEAILSSRRLVFTNDQVYFECNGMACLESLRTRLDVVSQRIKKGHSVPRVFPTFQSMQPPQGVFPTFQSMQPPQEFYSVTDWQIRYCWDLQQFESLIDKYTTRNLTFENDALNAFAGIGRSFAKHDLRPLPQVCGVPIIGRQSESRADLLEIRRNLFIAALSWSWSPISTRRHAFPSWSWAGWSCSRFSQIKKRQDLEMLINFEAACTNIAFEYPDSRKLTLCKIQEGNPPILHLDARPMKLPSPILDGPADNDYNGEYRDQLYLLQQDRFHTDWEKKSLIRNNTRSGKWRVILLGEFVPDTRLFNGFSLIIERCEDHWIKVGKMMLRTQPGLFESEREHFEIR